MNLIHKNEGTQIELGLKYCERCGGLFLRPIADDAVHCATCRSRFAALRSATELSGAGQQRGSRRTKNRTLLGSGNVHEQSISSLHGVAVMEGRPC
jgi:hypothetical protein